MMPRCCAYESKVLEKTLKGAEWRTAEKSKPVSYVIELTHNSNNDTHTMGLQWSGYRNPAFLSSLECFFFFSDTDDRSKSYIMALQIVLQYLCITISSLSLETCHDSSDSDRCVTLWLPPLDAFGTLIGWTQVSVVITFHFFDNAHCFSKFSNHITAMIVSFFMYFFSLGH